MCGDFLSSRTVKGRKRYRCEACSIVIPKGFEHEYTIFIDGGIQVSRMHLECREEFNRMLIDQGDDCGDPYMTWENTPDHVLAKYKWQLTDETVLGIYEAMEF